MYVKSFRRSRFSAPVERVISTFATDDCVAIAVEAPTVLATIGGCSPMWCIEGELKLEPQERDCPLVLVATAEVAPISCDVVQSALGSTHTERSIDRCDVDRGICGKCDHVVLSANGEPDDSVLEADGVSKQAGVRSLCRVTDTLPEEWNPGKRRRRRRTSGSKEGHGWSQ